MVLLRQSQAVSLALAVLLYLMPSSVLCDHYNEDTSDLTVMSIPEVCVHEVNKMLTNIAAFCEGSDSYVDALTSCQDMKSKLVSQLESQQELSRDCTAQLITDRSLLEKFLQQLSQSKERIRTMSGVAIRYQGDRTSLNDLLNRSHQQLLGTVNDMVGDIHKWKMNTSKWEGVSYRDFEESSECSDKYDTLWAKYRTLVLENSACKIELGQLRNKTDDDEMIALLGKINQTELELNSCKNQKDKCYKHYDNAAVVQKTLTEENRHLNEEVIKTEKELKQTKRSFHVQLKEFYERLQVNIENKDRFNNIILNLENQIVNGTDHLQLMLQNLTYSGDKTKVLAEEVRVKFEALQSVCKKLVQIKLSKSKQLSSCENKTSSLDKDKANLEKSLEKCKKETKELKENIHVYHNNLNSCNETKNQQEAEINKTRSLNRQLMQINNNLTEILHRCNESLQKEYQTNMDQMTEVESLNKELQLKNNQVKKLEDDKAEIIKEINGLKEALQLLKKEKDDLLHELKLKNDSLDTSEKSLHNLKVQYTSYKSSCENNLNSSQEKNEKQRQRFTEDLNKCSKNNSDLMVEKNALENEKQNCSKENENLKSKLMNEAKSLHECMGEKLNLSNTLVFRERDIQDLQREYDNMNLTSKLGHIKTSTRISELEIKLRYLEYLLKSNRNEIKMLQEYGVILIMLVNKNADMLSLLKETLSREGEEFTPVMDDRFESLLKRLLRSIEDHHSRIYTQLLQMKPYMDKVVPIRVRRQAQRGRTPDFALLGAAKENNMTEVGIMLDVGANVNVQDENGLTPLHWAAMQGHAEVAELLLCRGAEPNIQAQGRDIKTPLHLAAEYGHPDAVLVLLDSGSNIEARAMDYATPLLYAANRGKDEVVSILLRRGANIRSTNAYNKNISQLGAKFPKVIYVIQKYTARKS